MARYIFNDITGHTAETVLKEMHDNTLREIWINTNGGDLSAAFAIYDAIVGRGVRVIGTGAVQSAGLAILLGGDTRLATPNTRFMSHEVKLTGEEIPNEEDVKDLKKYVDMLANIYHKRASILKRTAQSMLSSTNYFGVDEAIQMGFIHGVYEGR